MTMSRRRLSDEEAALWSGYARSITPLPGSRSRPPPAEPQKRAPSVVRPPSPAPKAPLPEPAPLAPLGRRLKQRVARGREPIDARIDLHGMTQAQAHAALLRFLQRAKAEGARIVLVVTGKGGRGAERDRSVERGVLKRQVPIWLALPEFRLLVLGFEDAHVGHGGEGALYVRLRRAR